MMKKENLEKKVNKMFKLLTDEEFLEKIYDYNLKDPLKIKFIFYHFFIILELFF